MIYTEYYRLHIPSSTLNKKRFVKLKGESGSTFRIHLADEAFRLMNEWNSILPGVWQYWVSNRK